MKISTHHKNHQIFQDFPGPGHFTFIEGMNRRLAPWFSFLLNLMAEKQMDETVKNEHINSKKKTPKIINRSTLF